MGLNAPGKDAEAGILEIPTMFGVLARKHGHEHIFNFHASKACGHIMDWVVCEIAYQNRRSKYAIVYNNGEFALWYGSAIQLIHTSNQLCPKVNSPVAATLKTGRLYVGNQTCCFFVSTLPCAPLHVRIHDIRSYVHSKPKKWHDFQLKFLCSLPTYMQILFNKNISEEDDDDESLNIILNP